MAPSTIFARDAGITSGTTMPSKSPAQARLMAAAAHNPAFAKKVGVPQSVAREFNAHDAMIGILRGSRKGSHGKRPTRGY